MTLIPKTVIVMDRATAEWMATMFPGCTVAPLGGIDGIPVKGTAGRPRQHDDDADRKRAHRDRFKLELQAALDLVSGGNRVIGRFPELATNCASRCRSSVMARWSRRWRSDLAAIGGTVYASIYHAEPLDFFPRDDIEAFIDGLRFFHAGV